MSTFDDDFWSLGVDLDSFEERQRLDLLARHLRAAYDNLTAVPMPDHLDALARELERRLDERDRAQAKENPALH